MFVTVTAPWQALGAAVLEAAEALHPEARPERLALVLVQPGAAGPEGFVHRGMEPVAPGALAGAFHLIHVLAALEEGRITAHGDLDRAMRDMILWSSNSGANYVIDLLTGTTGDTALEGAEYLDWRSKRERLNRFFWRMGWPEWERCRIAQKLTDDSRYGREAQFAREGGDNLNRLTALAAARLMWELFEGDLPLSPPARGRAQAILSRDPAGADAANPGYQLARHLGGNLPEGTAIWSKAGQNCWTGEAATGAFRHDLIRLAAPGRAPLIAALMTEGEALARSAPDLLPGLGRMIWERAAAL